MNKLTLFKSLGKNLSFAAIVIAFAVWPLPGIEANPTGFQLFHNHATDLLMVQSDAIVNNRGVMAQNKKQTATQFNIYLLEGLIMSTEESSKLTPEVRASRLQRLSDELKIERKKIINQFDKLDKLESDWSGYGLASH